MEIIFNNTSQQIDDDATVGLLLQQLLGDKQKGIAVAVNQTIIPKTKWNDVSLRQHDNVLVIKATQGG
jgi:sulfur carrier protein